MNDKSNVFSLRGKPIIVSEDGVQQNPDIIAQLEDLLRKAKEEGMDGLAVVSSFADGGYLKCVHGAVDFTMLGMLHVLQAEVAMEVVRPDDD